MIVALSSLLAGFLAAAPVATPDFSSATVWNAVGLALLLKHCAEAPVTASQLDFWRDRLRDKSSVPTVKGIANVTVQDMAVTCLDLKSGSFVPTEQSRRYSVKEIVSVGAGDDLRRYQILDAREYDLAAVKAAIERWKVEHVDRTEGVPRVQDVRIHVSKGRVQDADRVDPTVARFVAMGRSAVPLLISELINPEPMPPGAVNLWNGPKVGDVALFVLLDFFADRDWSPTLPGMDFDSLVGTKPEGSSAQTRLDAFVEKNGRGALQKRWKDVWGDGSKYRWDGECKCVRPAAPAPTAEPKRAPPAEP